MFIKHNDTLYTIISDVVYRSTCNGWQLSCMSPTHLRQFGSPTSKCHAEHIPTLEETRVELPNTDAYLILRSEENLKAFVEAYGNLKVEWDHEFRVFRVPSFKAGREKASAAKQAWCDRYGCE